MDANERLGTKIEILCNHSHLPKRECPKEEKERLKWRFSTFMSRNQMSPGFQVIETVGYILLSFSVRNLGLPNTMARKYNLLSLNPLKVSLQNFGDEYFRTITQFYHFTSEKTKNQKNLIPNLRSYRGLVVGPKLDPRPSTVCRFLSTVPSLEKSSRQILQVEVKFFHIIFLTFISNWRIEIRYMANFFSH